MEWVSLRRLAEHTLLEFLIASFTLLKQDQCFRSLVLGTLGWQEAPLVTSFRIVIRH